MTNRKTCEVKSNVMNINYLEFEQPIADLLAHIEELKRLSADSNSGVDLTSELNQLEKKNLELTKKIFSSLSDWQISQLSRHPMRPYTLDYVQRIFTDFHELAGDRAFADDKAIVGGLARLNGRPVMVIGHQKGRDTKERTLRNFGMPRPEGYRKAMRLMKLAERFGMPVITFIDTPGAYPGVGDRVNMLEYSTYSVISPEGCASILWKSADKAPLAAEAMNITAHRIKDLGLIDNVVKEPLGGAHRNYDEMAENLKQRIETDLAELSGISADRIVEQRYSRLMKYGYC